LVYVDEPCPSAVLALADIDLRGRVQESFDEGVGLARAEYLSSITAGVCDSLPCIVKVFCVASAFFESKS
jgi:hypothetical protein